MPVDLAAIEAAERRIRPLLAPTPMVSSSWLSDALGAEVWLKLENTQPTGSFKVRGALNALAALAARDRHVCAVVTASAGNHGLALAWAAAQIGIAVRVHLPVTAPRAKRDAIARLGATLVDAADYDAAEVGAREDAATSRMPYVSPYNDASVIAGAGTAAVEMRARGRRLTRSSCRWAVVDDSGHGRRRQARVTDEGGANCDWR